ncbi:MAG: hypothetical protein AB2A00_27470 [Myxococcota bacterium]
MRAVWRAVGGVLAVGLAVTSGACSNPGGGSSSTSGSGGSSGGGGSSSGSPDLATFAEFCKAAYGGAFCNSPSCAPFDEARCRAAYDRLCNEYGAQVATWQSQGLVEYHAEGSGECVDHYNRFFSYITESRCDTRSQRELYVELYGYDPFAAPTCEDGKPVPRSSPFLSDCNSVLEGKVAQGNSCAGNEVCGSRNCENRPDGGCGTCGVGESPDEDPLDEGETCYFEPDGGSSRYLDCKSGLVCDSAVSHKCLSYVGGGEECGAGFKLCSGGCGFRCNGVDGGRGTCVPNPVLGEGCGYTGGSSSYVSCQRGLSCVPATDAGYPDFSHGRCRPHATAGQACSNGFNYDQYFGDYTGGFSYGAHPVCEVGAACNIPDGGSDGTCGTGPSSNPPGTGEPCTAYAEQPCADAGDVCVHRGNGNYTCGQRGGVGAPCGSTDGCEAPLWCRLGDGGPGRCEQPIADGQPCAPEEICGALSVCDDGVCKPIEQLSLDTPAMCQ